MGVRSQLLTITVITGLAAGYAFAAEQWPLEAETAPSSRDARLEEEGPSISIAKRVVESAGAFERYFRTAAAVRSDFDGAASVSGALMASGAYDARQLEEGAVAYAALVALQQPAFVDALSSYSADPTERRGFIERLAATPELILRVPGASQAAAMASGALGEMGSRLVSRGQAVTAAAFTVQREPWAQEPIAEPAERLARIRAAGVTPGRLSERETSQLLKHLVERRTVHESSGADARPTTTVLRGLSLAAAAVLGQASESRADSLSSLMRDPEDGTCLRRAKLNLHQCLAASGPQYEDVFCAGRHAMVETGQCIVRAAGGASADGVKVPIARDYARSASATVSVPVARTGSTDAGLDPPRLTADDAYDSQRSAYDSQRSAYDSQRSAYDAQRGAYDAQGGAYDAQGDAYDAQGGAFPTD